MSMEYTALDSADQLMLARDLLRAKESDHFRLSLVSEPNTEARLEQLAAQIDELRKKISELEGNAEKEEKSKRASTRKKKTDDG